MEQSGHLSEKLLARRWGLSHRTLERWRHDDHGPAYLKIGGRIVYAMTAILEDAARIIAERRVSYGDPRSSMATVAARWSITLGHPVTPSDVMLCMIDLKLARLVHDPTHHDSVVDVIGYAALLPEVTQ